MRFIVDENLPVSLAKWLRSHGHEADHTSELGLNKTPDLAVARRALDIGAVIVTKDRDYRTIMVGGRRPTVVLMRGGNASSAALLAVMVRNLADTLSQLESGELLVELGGAS